MVRSRSSTNESAPSPDVKDSWDKLEILLKPATAIVAAALAAYLGFLASNFLNRQQNIQASIELYAQLMSTREKADSDLRKEMFNTALTAFLDPHNPDPNGKLLKLELLAHNFHDSLDLTPLFEQFFRDLKDDQLLIRRLEALAAQVHKKQLAVLETVGSREDFAVDISQLETSGTILNGDIPMTITDSDGVQHFSLEILSIDHTSRRVWCRLLAFDEASTMNLDYTLEVGVFDFPMIRNIRLPGGARWSPPRSVI